MKVKIEMTIDVDRKAILALMDGELGDETPTEYVKSYLMACTQVLDQQIANETGIYHQTKIMKTNHKEWGGDQ